MGAAGADRAVFVTLVESLAGARRCRVLAESIRAFGGELAGCPIWVFSADPADRAGDLAGIAGVRPVRLDGAAGPGRYPFAAKVAACARAEEMAPRETGSLIWVDPECLVVRPPVQMVLAGPSDVAVRPVHVSNVGSRAAASPDAFWAGVYRATGVGEAGTPEDAHVESFVDRIRLRAYYNTHAFAVVPCRGLLGRWKACFDALAGDREFQERACGDALHRVFLHQAVLSALIGSAVPASRLRILTPEYNYPYNLQASIPTESRAGTLNGLVIVVAEERSLDPDRMGDIEVREPLRSWLAERKDRVL